MAVKNVVKTSDGYTIDIENKSNKPLPVDLIFTYEDGSTSTQHYTIGIWEKGDRLFKTTLKTTKKVNQVVMKSSHVPDKDRSDNTFMLK